jgi:hypothetical protein
MERRKTSLKEKRLSSEYARYDSTIAPLPARLSADAAAQIEHPLSPILLA